MNDLKHLGSRRRPIPWASIIKVIVIVTVMIWMGERDRQHVIEKNALADVVSTQAYIIDTMQCGGAEFQMSSPLGRVES